MFSKVLLVDDLKTWKSTSIMDALELQDSEGNPKYDCILVKNMFNLWHGDYCFHVSLYIGRYWIGDACYHADATFSKLKKDLFGKEIGERSKDNYCISSKAYELLDSMISGNDELDEGLFDAPVCFHAQNSLDRSGFGYNEKRYGDSSTYAFLGAKFTCFYKL